MKFKRQQVINLDKKEIIEFEKIANEKKRQQELLMKKFIDGFGEMLSGAEYQKTDLDLDKLEHQSNRIMKTLQKEGIPSFMKTKRENLTELYYLYKERGDKAVKECKKL